MRQRCEVADRGSRNAEIRSARGVVAIHELQRRWIDREELLVESSVVRGAQHETVSRVVTPSLPVCPQVRGVQKTHHRDIADGASRSVAAKHTKTESMLPRSRAQTNLPPAARRLLELEREAVFLVHGWWRRRRRLAERDQEHLCGVVPILDPTEINDASGRPVGLNHDKQR